MNRSILGREGWHPQTLEDRDAVFRELREVLASPHFCNSKRYPALLQYIVENTLAGRSDLLKERTLGVEVFDRPPTYDTNADTVVRYTAGEVRKRLLLYYSEHGRMSNIRISLPAGSYVPEFLHGHDGLKETGENSGSVDFCIADSRVLPELAGEMHEPGPISALAVGSLASHPDPETKENGSAPISGRKAVAMRLLWFVPLRASPFFPWSSAGDVLGS